MSLNNPIFYFFLGSITSFLILKNSNKFLKRFFLDTPNKRSLHVSPIPRAGGLCFVIPLLLFDLFWGYFNNWQSELILSLYFLPLIIISFIDDFKKVPSKYRYLIQLFTAFWVLEKSNVNYFSNNIFLNIFCFLFFLLFITAVTNFTNFMDGSDGLVAGCMLIFLITLSLKFQSNLSIYLLQGSLLIFLLWNWYPAKIFMGDVGSTFLGMYYVANLLQLKEINEILGIFLIAAPFFGDAFVTVIRRFIYGQNIFMAHRQHLYQRLCLGILSKRQVAFFYMAQSIFIAFIYFRFNIIYEIVIIPICFLIMYLFDVKYALSFKESIKNSLN
tara:strand:- start:984 stop:1970 length:987 start_codon:yes stop_codon:yes gene_type:complete